MERILLVEDEESMRILIGDDLEDAGFKTEFAKHGSEALEKLKMNSIEGIVTDLVMSGMDGWQLCKTLREQGCKLPIVVYTTLQDPDGLENYANKVIKKSPDTSELINYLKSL
ncbi:MAG: response regulator [archaeon]